LFVLQQHASQKRANEKSQFKSQ